MPPGTTDIKKALETRQEELHSTEEKTRTLERDVEALREERERITQKLVETGALVQRSEEQMSAIEARMGELEAQEKIVRGSLQQRYADIAKLLAALQRMGRNPPPVMITRREDALKMVRSAMLLSAAFPGMKTQASALAEKLSDLDRVIGGIRREGDRLKVETQRLSEMKAQLAGLVEEKKKTLSERRAELDRAKIAAAEISRNVGDLSELINKLDRAVAATEASTPGLAAYEKELRSQPAAPAPGQSPEQATSAAATPPAPSLAPPPPAPGPSPASPGPSPDSSKLPEVALLTPSKVPEPAPVTSPPIVELAPVGTSLVPGKIDRIKPAIPFHEARGKLPMPAHGRLVLTYGDKTQFGGQSKGIVIETRSSAQITSPCDGWVVYAGEFRSYGQLLIINAGGGYHVLLAGLSQIDVQPGQFVVTSEPVGTMSKVSKSTNGSSQGGGPVLYVEFRKDGDPINPDPWWVKNQQVTSHQKVQ
jgi:septal ring factor EnvC (AmiA/AmiB activator)